MQEDPEKDLYIWPTQKHSGGRCVPLYVVDLILKSKYSKTKPS